MTRFPVVRELISSEKSHAVRAALVILIVLVATVIRISMSGFASLTFATYYPAVLVCGLLAGWRYGAASALLSGIVAESLFPPVETGGAVEAANFLLFLIVCAMIIATAESLRRTIRKLDEANASADALNRELQHRVGNMLAVVQALAAQSAKNGSPADFVAAFNGRLNALATAHQVLRDGRLETCGLPALVDLACQPFYSGGNIIKSGPSCQLPSDSCVPLVLALHELCTNAVKYGSLAVPGGRVELTWFVDEADKMTMVWKELNGPPVRRPSRRGTGSALLQPQKGLESVDLEFLPKGVICTFVIHGVQL